ncbi:MAG: hypothetical protein K1X79_09230 [Oligoflexia bacterium]|nr:hypothetical protein [Oligoflexia bacterium]
MPRLTSRKIIQIGLSALLLGVLFGCGGGTVSTSRPNSSISGSIKSSAGAGVAGVTVTNPESGESAVSDGDGNFTLGELPTASGPLTLLVEKGQLSAQVDLGNAPSEDAEIVVAVVVDTAAKQVQKATVDVRPRPTPTAIPAATIIPIGTPTPTASPTPTVVPIEPVETVKPVDTPEARLPMQGKVVLRSGAGATGVSLRFYVPGGVIDVGVDEAGGFSTPPLPRFGKLKKGVLVTYKGEQRLVNLAKTSLGKVPKNAFVTKLNLEVSVAKKVAANNSLRIKVLLLEYTFASGLTPSVQLVFDAL